MIKNIIFIILVIISVYGIHGQQENPLKDMFVVDCSGTLRFMPDHLFSASLQSSVFVPMVNFINGLMSDAAKCNCNGISNGDIEGHFSTNVDELFVYAEQNKTAVLNTVTCPSAKLPFTHTMDDEMFGSFFQMIEDEGLFLPSTCDRTSMENGEGCRIKMSAKTQFEMEFEWSLKKCPDSKSMFMSFGCTDGDTCKNAFTFCSTDSDCLGNSICEYPQDVFNRTQDQVNQDLLESLIDMGIWNTQRADCSKSGIASAVQLITAMTGFVSKHISNGNSDHLKMCGLTAFYEGVNDLNDKYNDTGNLTLTDVFDCVDNDDKKCLLSGTSDLLTLNRLNGGEWTDSTPSATLDTSGVALLEAHCSGDLDSDVTDMSLHIEHAQGFIDAFYTAARDIQQCQYSSTWNDLQYGSQMMAHQPGLWLRLLTGLSNLQGNVGTKIVNSTFDAVMDDMFFNQTDGDWSRLEMPSSCSFANWIQNGECKLRYDLGALMSLDVELRLQIVQCPAPNNLGIPAGRIDCVGADCSRLLFEEIKHCTSDGACLNDEVCTEMPSIEEVFDMKSTFWSQSEGYEKFVDQTQIEFTFRREKAIDSSPIQQYTFEYDVSNAMNQWDPMQARWSCCDDDVKDWSADIDFDTFNQSSEDATYHYATGTYTFNWIMSSGLLSDIQSVNIFSLLENDFVSFYNAQYKRYDVEMVSVDTSNITVIEAGGCAMEGTSKGYIDGSERKITSTRPVVTFSELAACPTCMTKPQGQKKFLQFLRTARGLSTAVPTETMSSDFNGFCVYDFSRLADKLNDEQNPQYTERDVNGVTLITVKGLKGWSTPTSSATSASVFIAFALMLIKVVFN